MFISNIIQGNMKNKKEVKVIKDFGEVTVPTSWDEVTLNDFIKLTKIQDEKEDNTNIDMIDIMTVLTAKDRKYIYSLPSDFVDSIMGHLIFLNKPLDATPSPVIEYQGNTYKINYMEKLKMGEYVDANTILQADKYDYSNLLAVLCRQEGEVYDDDFIADKMEERAQMYLNMPITKVYPLICFFLQLSIISNQHLEHYLTEAEDHLNRFARDIKDSLTHGDGKKLSLTLRMKALWKLRQLNKVISQPSSHSSATSKIRNMLRKSNQTMKNLFARQKDN